MNRFLSVSWLSLFCAVVVLTSGMGMADMIGVTQPTTAATIDLAGATLTTAGYEFETGATPIVVTGLGVWDESGSTSPTPGLNASHEVAIWLASGAAGAPLADATVPVGNSGTQINAWLFVSLGTPLVLSANTNYVIGVATAGDVFHGSIITPPGDWPVFNTPDVSFVERRADATGSFVRPDGFNESGDSAWDAPNFEFTVPEPASMSLVMLGGASLLRRRRV